MKKYIGLYESLEVVIVFCYATMIWYYHCWKNLISHRRKVTIDLIVVTKKEGCVGILEGSEYDSISED